MDERLKPGQLHETPEEANPLDTYPEFAEESPDVGFRKEGNWPSYPPYNDLEQPPFKTRAADEGSSATLRSEREGKAESGGYSDPGYGKVRDLPSQK